MSMRIKDGISPELTKMAKRFSNRRPILKVMGASLVSVSQEAFRNPSFKQPLMGSGALRRALRVGAVTNNAVTVSVDRVYAAIHQYGGKIVAKGKSLHFMMGGKDVFVKSVVIPARPYMPFDDNGTMTPAGQKRVGRATKAKMKAMMPPGTR